jgi:hypothetical protein
VQRVAEIGAYVRPAAFQANAIVTVGEVDVRERWVC